MLHNSFNQMTLVSSLVCSPQTFHLNLTIFYTDISVISATFCNPDFYQRVGGWGRRPRPGGVQKPRKLSFSSGKSSKLFFATQAALGNIEKSNQKSQKSHKYSIELAPWYGLLFLQILSLVIANICHYQIMCFISQEVSERSAVSSTISKKIMCRGKYAAGDI